MILKYIILVVIAAFCWQPLPAQTLKEKEAASRARIKPIANYFNNLRWSEKPPYRKLFDTLYKAVMKEAYIDFFGSYELYNKCFVFSADSQKLFKARLPVNMLNGYTKLLDYYVEKLYESQHPQLKSTYPADVPLPGMPLTTTTVIAPKQPKNTTTGTATVPKADGTTTTTTSPAATTKKLNSPEQWGRAEGRTGKVYIVKGYVNNYKNASDNKVYFYATHTDGTYLYGLTCYYVNVNSGGYAKRAGDVRLSGKVLIREKQLADHEQFTDSKYYHGSCSKTLDLCNKCDGSGNGASRNTKRAVTTISTTPGSTWGKKVTYDEVFYDYYPCNGCKGKGWLE